MGARICIAHDELEAGARQTLWSEHVRYETKHSGLVQTFDKYGVVLFDSGLPCSTLSDLYDSMLRCPHKSSRGGSRWCTNHADNRKLKCYNEVMCLESLHMALDQLTEFSLMTWTAEQRPKSTWQFNSRIGGDVVPAKELTSQRLHTDWGTMATSSMVYGFCLAVSVAPGDIDPTMAPLCLIPWSEPCARKNSGSYYFGLGELPASYLLTLKKGEIMIRDVRACHGGTPNVSSVPRCLPGFQVLSPQYQESGFCCV